MYLRLSHDLNVARPRFPRRAYPETDALRG